MSNHVNRKRALVADDDLTFQILIEQALAEASFDVVCVEDGQAAIDCVLEDRPDLIFLDNYMPKISGLQACARLQSELAEACPPIVIITSAGGDQHIEDAFTAGASDYLLKPVNWLLFQHRIAGWLSQRGGQDTTMASLDRKQCELVISRSGEIAELTHNCGFESLVSAKQVGETLRQVFPALVADQILKLVKRALKTRAAEDDRIELQLQGEQLMFEVRVSACGIQKANVVIQRCMDEQQSKSQLFRMAYTDAATGLPNRHLYALRSKDYLLKAEFQSRDLTFVCLTFENMQGSDGQDHDNRELLRASIDATSDALRAEDYVVKFDMPLSSPVGVASKDDQSFLLLLNHGATDEYVGELGLIVRRACESVAAESESQQPLMPRIGFSRYPDDGTELDLLLETAHLAAREALKSRAEVFRLGGKSARRNVLDQWDGEAELDDALEKGQLQMHYQPRVDLHSERVQAVEALVRWPHTLLGQIPAAELFGGLAGAESVRRLSDWALREACTQAARWQAEGQTVIVSINLSCEQVLQDQFVEHTLDLLAELALQPEHIELEVTDAILECSDYALQHFQDLCNAGIGLIIDDFGVGNVNLQALRRLRIKGFKVNHNRTRVAPLDGGESGVYSIAHAIAMACGADLIAKNIESSEELERARLKNCDQAQGFHICQPLPAKEIADYITKIALSQTSPLEVAREFDTCVM